MRTKKEELRTLFWDYLEEACNIGTWFWQAGDKEVECSKQLKAFWQIKSSSDFLKLDTFLALLPLEERSFFEKELKALEVGEQKQCFWQREFFKQGRFFRHTIVCVNKRKLFILGIVQDITSLKDLSYKSSLADMIFKNSLEGVVITDAKGDIIDVNPAFTKITGYKKEEVLGQNPRILKSDRHPQDFYAKMWQDLLNKGKWEGEIWNRRKSGEVYPEFLSIQAVKDKKGNIVNYISVFIDLTEQKRIEEDFRYFRFYDPLTNLMNRELLLNRIKEKIEEKNSFGLFLIDLDNFKEINEVFSYKVGDNILKNIGESLVFLAGKNDVARVGEDSFALLFNFKSYSQIENMVSKIKIILNKINIENTILNLSCCIGISIYPDDTINSQDLLRFAESALNRAREGGYNKHRYFNREMYKRATARINKITELKEAINLKEFIPFYQPKIDLKNKQIIGFEALARWKKPDGRIIFPSDFIELAEKEGFILPLTYILLEKIAKDLVLVYEKFPEKNISCAVNLSLACFEGVNWSHYLKELCKKFALPPTAFQVEITESMLMQKESLLVDSLFELVQNNILVSLDDFGTGYSSLYYLKKLPIYLVKIDRSFVMDLKAKSKEEKLIKAIVEMSKALDIKVCAEGVENKEQLHLLTNLGCDMVQGYYFSPPVDFTKALSLLDNFSSSLFG